MLVRCASCSHTYDEGEYCPSCGARSDPSLGGTPPPSGAVHERPRRSPSRRLLLALGVVTVVLAILAGYSMLRPSAVSVAQLAAHAGDIECTDSSGGTLDIRADGTWSQAGPSGGIGTQGTWVVDGDTLMITGGDDIRTMSLKVSGLSGVRLTRDALPIAVSRLGGAMDGETVTLGLDSLQGQSWDGTMGCGRV